MGVVSVSRQEGIETMLWRYEVEYPFLISRIFHLSGGCECACYCVFRKPILIPFLVYQQQIGQLKEPIKLTTRICKTFGHFHLFYIHIYY